MSTVISCKQPTDSGMKFVCTGTRMKWVSHVMVGYKYLAIATDEGIVQNPSTEEETKFASLQDWLQSLPKGPGSMSVTSPYD